MVFCSNDWLEGVGGISTTKYICLSDIHAGAETSLITTILSDGSGGFVIDPTRPSPVTKALARAMRPTLEHLERPQSEPANLLLLGDVLDLSLSPPDRSAQVFETFAHDFFLGPEKGGKELRLSRQVYFLPGNHDHSLWTALRYQTERFINGRKKAGRTLFEKGVLSRFDQVTPAFTKPNDDLQSSLIRDIVETATGQDFTVPVYYPNLGDVSSDGTRAVVFHHGHFIEATYRMLSILLAGFHGREVGPLTVEQLERENGNWIDFGWSTIGENGPIGEDVASVYQFLLTGSEEGRLQDRIARTLAENLMNALPLPKTNQVRDAVGIISKGIIDATVGKFSQTERLSYTSYLGADSIQGLRDYLLGAVGRQMLDRFGDDQPTQTAFVFGHTHKPFEDQIVVDGTVSDPVRHPEQLRMFEAPVEVYNTGGWILDTSLLSTKEGASIIFVDDEMNVASLRAFNITADDAPPEPYVHSLDPGNPMELALKDAVAANKDLWSVFAQTVGEELKVRQQVILTSTASADLRSAPRKVEQNA